MWKCYLYAPIFAIAVLYKHKNKKQNKNDICLPSITNTLVRIWPKYNSKRIIISSPWLFITNEISLQTNFYFLLKQNSLIINFTHKQNVNVKPDNWVENVGIIFTSNPRSVINSSQHAKNAPSSILSEDDRTPTLKMS